MSFYAYVKQPEDDETIWHYLDFAKFMLLLDHRALFFEQANHLNLLLEGHGAIGQVMPGTTGQEQNNLPDFTTLSRACLVVNCWYMHNQESAALWKQQSDAIVAIQSSVRRLKKSLNFSLLKYAKIGAVNYHPPVFNPDETGVSIEVDYYFKRQSFQHERELRLLAHARDLTTVTQNGGIVVPATLETLITEFRIAPTAQPWLVGLIRSVIKDAYHLDTTITQTDLHDMAIV